MSTAESALNALRRLPENRFCGTCRKEDRFGHKNVCMKYRIFVCSDCKSAHQAFSHKCKSVTMSNWSMAEVDELKAPHGGNAKNRATIFANLKDDSDAWPKSCPPDVVKEFVQLAYEKLRWHDASSALPRTDRSASASDELLSTPTIGRPAPSVSSPAVCFAEMPRVESCRTAPLPKTTSASLLDDDLLCAFEPPSAKLAQRTQSATDDWAPFTSAPVAVDDWSGFEGAGRSLPAAPVTPMAKDPFGGIEALAAHAAPMKPMSPMVATPIAPTPPPAKSTTAATPPLHSASAAARLPSPARAGSADPFSALGASGFASLGATAPTAKPTLLAKTSDASAAAATKPLSGVGVAKDLSGPAAASCVPSMVSAPLRATTGPGPVTAGALGSEFIDTTAYRNPPQRVVPCMAFAGRSGAAGAAIPPAMPRYSSVRAA